MSRIFDALQRLEAEHSGVPLSKISGAPEVLRSVELQATSEAGKAAVSEQASEARMAERGAPFEFNAVSPVATAVEATAASEPSVLDQSQDMFGLFQSLKVTLSPQSRLVCLGERGSPAAEAFRLLGVRLRHLRRDRSLKRVLITSTVPKEGKSMVAANLACVLALRTKQRVLLLEGDVRRPTLSQIFELGKNRGLCEWLEGKCNLAMSIYHLEGPGLWFLPAGSPSTNQLDLDQSGKLSTLLDQLTAWFDWIIIDSPPVLPLADTSIWTRLADGILLVMRQGTTQKRQLEKGLEALESKKLIGAVLNGSKNPEHSDYYYGTVAASGTNDDSRDKL
jgi:capsular exopolysaccharide synthesis family protein